MLRSEICGEINMKCNLSGTPNLKLGLNDKVFFEVSGRTTRSRTIEMDDLKFHQCVDINKFGNERVIEFIPPDGEFELANYRLNTQVKIKFKIYYKNKLKPLIWVEVVIESNSTTKVEYRVKAKSNYRVKSIAHNVEIMIPVPNDLRNPLFKVNYLF
jgi:AP-1 complex subunit mu